jgi:hypothetical protein
VNTVSDMCDEIFCKIDKVLRTLIFRASFDTNDCALVFYQGNIIEGEGSEQLTNVYQLV